MNRTPLSCSWPLIPILLHQLLCLLTIATSSNLYPRSSSTMIAKRIWLLKIWCSGRRFLLPLIWHPTNRVGFRWMVHVWWWPNIVPLLLPSALSKIMLFAMCLLWIAQMCFWVFTIRNSITLYTMLTIISIIFKRRTYLRPHLILSKMPYLTFRPTYCLSNQSQQI